MTMPLKPPHAPGPRFTARPPVGVVPKPRSTPLMRRVEVLALMPDGVAVAETTRLVPAMPAFDDAFAAFARGAMLATERGPVAIEDLWPGARVKTADGTFATLLWRGSTMIVPRARGQDPAMGKLVRIAADALGLGRPMPDLVLGPRARIVSRAPGVRVLTGGDAAAVPATDFIDGVGIVELTPPTPVQVFHLGFARQQRIATQGLEIESQHPGPPHELGLRPELLQLYLSCFPHVGRIEGFGLPTVPRLRRADLDLFHLA